MKLSTGKRRHLISAYATVSHLLLQMEEAALEGRSPTGVGPPLTPLPRNEADAVLAPLRNLKARLREVAQTLAPVELAELEQRQSVSNSVVWLSNLLDHIRIAVDGLEPRRVRKYGELDPEEKELFEGLHTELFEHVGISRSSLDELLQATAKIAGSGSRGR